MGYVVDVHEFEFNLRESNPARVADVLGKLEWLPVHREGDVLTFSDYSFKWSSLVYLDMVRLSEIAEGYIVFRGEDGVFWKMDIRDGKIVDYDAELVFHITESYSLDLVKKLMSGCYEDDRIVAMIVGGRGCVIDRKSLGLSVHDVSSLLESLNRYLETRDPGLFHYRDVREVKEIDDLIVKEVIKRLMDAGLKEIALALSV